MGDRTQSKVMCFFLVERDPMARGAMLPVGKLHTPLVANYFHI
jgi:hypothetical protein